MSFLDETYYDNRVSDYLIAAGVAVGVFLGALIVRWLIARRLKKFAERTATRIDDMVIDLLGRTRSWVILVVSVFIATQSLDLDTRLTHGLRVAAIIAVLFQIGLWAGGAIRFATSNYRERKLAAGDTGSVSTIVLLSNVARLITWVMVVLLILDNLGVNVTALVAGLGIGGIAIALAVQSILADLFASISIMLDKPFEVGDLIVVGMSRGRVEHIGVKTTRVRSLEGEELVYSNNELLKAQISNFRRLNERRSLFSVGVTYQTPADKLREIPDMLRSIVESEENVRFDRAHFKLFGDSALVFEVAYYVTSSDYLLYMDTQQRINFAIVDAFERDHIDIAYPTQTVWLNQTT